MTREQMVIGTRGSALAMIQARWLQTEFKKQGIDTRIEAIQTHGDKVTEHNFAQMSVQGVFTKEIEEALLDGRVDLALHCLKDLPTRDVPGLCVAAICEREDPRDCLIIAEHAYTPKETGLPLIKGARVGTSAKRRGDWIQYVQSDVVIAELRGNVGTRIQKLQDGKYDAIVLAMAGLNRLQWEVPYGLVQIPLSPEAMLPSPGQGALAIQVRENDTHAWDAARMLHHLPTARAVHMERTLVRLFDGGCNLPLAAFAEVFGDQLRLRAAYGKTPSHWAMSDMNGTNDEHVIYQTYGRLIAP